VSTDPTQCPAPAAGLYALRADQRAIETHAARFKVVACGRRWGKTMLGLVMAVTQARAGRRVWWVAPTYSMAFEPWRALKQALEDEWAYKLEAEHHIDLPGRGSITVKSADNPDTLRGVGLDFVVIDEAAFMAEEVWFAALRPALSDRGGQALIISTPRGRNWFWRLFNRGMDPLNPDWQAWQAPTAANPRIMPQDLDEARALLAARTFEQEYEAKFVEDGGTVFRRVREAAGFTAPDGPQAGGYYVMGVDFGRQHDFTALAVIDTRIPALVALDRFSETFWNVQRARITALARRWQVRAVLAEANAMGEPNIEALQCEGLPVQGFVTTRASKPPLIETLVKALEDGELQQIPDPVLIAELEAYTYSVDRYGHAHYGAAPGQHDDTVIALALAWKLASTPRMTFAIAEV
jgi:hypothetical protein